LRAVSDKPLHIVGSAGAANRRRLRIVVADDERDTATTLALLLRDEGHEVHTVLRGDEVLELCRLTRPDVVIADVNMPGMSGFAIARELRERHGPLAPLLIAVSGVWTKTADRLVGKDAGFDHYLLKPCEPRELLPLLGPLMTTQAGARRA
jgi:two-component system, OmpR family, response regulator